jgi:hypothetical protein
MSDAADDPYQKRMALWGAAALAVATTLSYVGLFVFIWLSDHVRWIVIPLWVLGTTLGLRLGMRALKKLYYSLAKPRNVTG